MKDYSVYFKKPSLADEAKRTREPVVVNKEGLKVDEITKNMGKDKKYFVRTYGCQGNEADGETIAGILEFIGYIKADALE